MDVVMRPWLGEPTRWVVVFDRKTERPWLNRLPIGKYKHVRAFGYVAAARAWIFYDWSLDRGTIKIASDQYADQMMAHWLKDADAIGMPVVERALMMPRFGGWCVPAIKHLIGLRSGALRPDALWRDCLANGGEIVAHEAAITRHNAGPATASHANAG